ncbi:hypothetical protein ASZ78_006219, partial [Callipepla squamata]
MRKLTGNVVAEKADVENEILTCHLHIQQEQLLEHKGGDGRDQLLDVIQTELRARPDDTDLNIRLVALCCSSNKLRDAVLHCQEAEKTSCRVKLGMVFLCHTDIGGIQSDFDPVVIFRVLETSEYLEAVRDVESDQKNWRAVKKDHLLSCFSCVKLMLLEMLENAERHLK